MYENDDYLLKKMYYHRKASKLLCLVAYFLFSIFYFSKYEITCKNRSLNHFGTSNCDTRPWNYLESVYFAVVTMCTIGYSDYYPTNSSTKIATILFVIFGLYTTISLIGDILRWTFLRAHIKAENYGKVISQRLKEYLTSHHMMTVNEIRTDGYLVDEKHHVLKQIIYLLIVILIGTIFFSLTEKWFVVDSIYFSLTVVTTVGYGSSYPVQDSSLIFLCLYIPLGFYTSVNLIAILIYNILVEHLIESRIWALHEQLNFSGLKSYYKQDNLQVQKNEFCLLMLLSMGHITQLEIEYWWSKFEARDKSKRGYLLSSEAREIAPSAHKRRKVFQAQAMNHFTQSLLDHMPTYRITSFIGQECSGLLSNCTPAVKTFDVDDGEYADMKKPASGEPIGKFELYLMSRTPDMPPDKYEKQRSCAESQVLNIRMDASPTVPQSKVPDRYAEANAATKTVTAEAPLEAEAKPDFPDAFVCTLDDKVEHTSTQAVPANEGGADMTEVPVEKAGMAAGSAESGTDGKATEAERSAFTRIPKDVMDDSPAV